MLLFNFDTNMGVKEKQESQQKSQKEWQLTVLNTKLMKFDRICEKILPFPQQFPHYLVT